MPQPIQKPKFVGPLMPTKGPVVSRFEVMGNEIVIASGGTLPPVCLKRGRVMELSKATYKLDYLVLGKAGPQPEELLGHAMGVHGSAEPVFSGKAMVRFALSDASVKSSNRAKILPIVLVFGILACAILAGYLPKLGVPRQTSGLIVMAVGATLFALVVLASKKALVSLVGRPLKDGRIAISGIDKNIIKRMLQWQHDHSTNTTHTS